MHFRVTQNPIKDSNDSLKIYRFYSVEFAKYKLMRKEKKMV